MQLLAIHDLPIADGHYGINPRSTIARAHGSLWWEAEVPILDDWVRDYLVHCICLQRLGLLSTIVSLILPFIVGPQTLFVEFFFSMLQFRMLMKVNVVLCIFCSSSNVCATQEKKIQRSLAISYFFWRWQRQKIKDCGTMCQVSNEPVTNEKKLAPALILVCNQCLVYCSFCCAEI